MVFFRSQKPCMKSPKMTHTAMLAGIRCAALGQA
jgi:hypothetical protein